MPKNIGEIRTSLSSTQGIQLEMQVSTSRQNGAFAALRSQQIRWPFLPFASLPN